jgi:FtsP/CotA-like multicopper oxidase with cupredoxin domain
MTTRRQFLQLGASAGAGLAMSGRHLLLTTRRALAYAQSPTSIRKFVTTLPGLGPGHANNLGHYLPLAVSGAQTFAGLAIDTYALGVAQFGQRIHPDLPAATRFWGYYDLTTRDQKYLGGVIVARRNRPVLLSVTNNLPDRALVPVDPTLPTSETHKVGQLPMNRIATHLHGGFTPWFSDGTPFQWYTPSGQTGVSFHNVPGTTPPPGTATYYYPMDQSARLLWYHDHAIGITRTNAYVGIASALVLTDDFESYLLNRGLLPDLVGIPCIIQDKSFVARDILTQDPTWNWGRPGDLWYPHEYEFTNGPYPTCALNVRGRWDYGPCVSPPAVLERSDYTLPVPSCVPEAFLDTTLVNGAPYPVVNVTDRTFRFRLLNGSQARFWHLNLYREGAAGEADLSRSGPPMYQVATEGGFLPAVAVHPNGIRLPREPVDSDDANPDGPFNLLLAPAERADVLIDFTGLTGASFILYNDATAPFPSGDPINDYFTQDKDQTAIGGAPPTQPGFGPNTRTVMKIVVGKGPAGPLPSLEELNEALKRNFTTGNAGVAPQQPALLARFNRSTGQYEVPDGVPILNKTLSEDFDEFGRLLQRAGTDTQFTNNQALPTFGRNYMSAATENPTAGAVQVWDFYNTTGDTHPWHFHLVNVQVVGRGVFFTQADGSPIFGSFQSLSGTSGRLTAPDPNEEGWKETVRMNPGEITRVIMKFDLPKLPSVMGDPKSPRTGGHEYVHHCHILEHEEHDMMRPLIVS